MKKFKKIFTSRVFVVAVAVILQVLWIYFLCYQVSLGNNYVNLFFHILSVIVAVYIINGKKNPAYKIAWIFWILLVPILGIVMYFLMGRPDLTIRTRKKMEAVNHKIAPCMEADSVVDKKINELNEDFLKTVRYLESYGKYPAYGNTETSYYKNGEELLPDLLEELEKAEHFIFMEYFIFAYGYMYDQIFEILKRKARGGVDVRIIYDDVGSIDLKYSKIKKEFPEYGIKCVPFNTIKPFVSIIMNNRDHRKILVVDGKTAFNGGINIADEYINKIVRFGYWKDTAVRIRGDAVWNFTCMFLEMWNYITGDLEDPYEFKVQKGIDDEKIDDGFVQPYADSPLDDENVGENVYLNIIGNAKKYVYICTPYLIIDHEMENALCNAAKCGIDVRIITPGIPDKKLIYAFTQSYYCNLLESGVKIYQYTPGFIHAKSVVADDNIAVVGSINMDYRSFYLHFECATLMYQSRAVMQVKEDTDHTIEDSESISLEYCRTRKLPVRLMQKLLYTFAPLL